MPTKNIKNPAPKKASPKKIKTENITSKNKNLTKTKAKENNLFSLQKEYIRFHDTANLEDFSEEKVIQDGLKLFENKTQDKTKKEILFALAHLGTWDSLSIIADFIKKTENQNLKNWAELCKDECQLFLKSSIIEDRQNEEDHDCHDCDSCPGCNDQDFDKQSALKNNMEFTIMGTENGRLPFVFVLAQKENLSEKQKQLTEKIIQDMADGAESKITKIDFAQKHIAVFCDISLLVAPADLIEESIIFCKEEGIPLHNSYFITYGNELFPEDLEDFLEDIEKNNTKLN